MKYHLLHHKYNYKYHCITLGKYISLSITRSTHPKAHKKWFNEMQWVIKKFLKYELIRFSCHEEYSSLCWIVIRPSLVVKYLNGFKVFHSTGSGILCIVIHCRVLRVGFCNCIQVLPNNLNEKNVMSQRTTPAKSFRAFPAKVLRAHQTKCVPRRITLTPAQHTPGIWYINSESRWTFKNNLFNSISPFVIQCHYKSALTGLGIVHEKVIELW